MKKQALTKQDVQKELLTKLNKRKSISIFLTAIVIIGIILYPIHLVNYLNEIPLDYTGGFRSPDITPTVAIFVIPFLIIFFAVFVFYLYYMDLYKIKKGKFEIIEDVVCQKENSLYFRCGRVEVEDKVYSYSNVGDKFYIVILKSKSKNNPRMAYHMEYYKINVD